MEINSNQIQSLDFKRRCCFFFILVSMLVFPFNQLKSQNFNQSEFVIGTYGERQMDIGWSEIDNYLTNPISVPQNFFDRQNEHIVRLTGIKNAHFNLMSGLTFTYGGSGTPGNLHNMEILYSMNLIGSTPHLSGLKTLVKNSNLFGSIGKTTTPTMQIPSSPAFTYSAVFDNVYTPTGSDYNLYCPNGNCNNVLYGFHPMDEPAYHDRDNLYAWGNYINLKTPGKVTFINFSGGSYWGNVFNTTGRDKYKHWLDHYINPSAPTFYTPDVVGFTYYPFITESRCETNLSDQASKNIAKDNLEHYFWALSTTKAKAGNKPLWAIAMSAKHDHLIYKSHPWLSQITNCPNESNGDSGHVRISFTNPTYNHLMFMDFCPLAYGAKGIFYFTYDWPTTPDFANAITHPEHGTCTQRYEDVKNINHYLKKIVGPVIMNSQWKNAVHKSNLPTNEAQLTSTGELKDDLLTSSHFLISDIENSNILIGTFEQQCDYYLLVVNKDLNPTPSSFKIKLKGIWYALSIAPSVGTPPLINNVATPCVISDPGSPYGGSTAYSSLARSHSYLPSITTFTMPVLQGGEGRMVKISRCESEGNPGGGSNGSNMAQGFGLTISPNPASDVITIGINNIPETSIDQQCTLQFTDNYGNWIDNIPVTLDNENMSISYTLPEGIETGLYHMILNVGGVNIEHVAVQVIR